MRSRTKTLLALGVACLSTAVVASGALADGGHKGGKNKASLEVEVTGSIVTIDSAFVVISAGATLPSQTCAIPAGKNVTAFTSGARVKAKCRQRQGVLKLKKLRLTTSLNDKLKIEANGVVKAFTAAVGTTPGTIVVDTGLTVPAPVTCAVTDRTRVRGNPVVDGMAKIECKSKAGVLTAKKIKAKRVKVPKVEAKGLLTINGTTSVTVGTVTCSIPAGTTVNPALAGQFVEIKCVGAAPTSVLTKIELEDDDDHHHHHH